MGVNMRYALPLLAGLTVLLSTGVAYGSPSLSDETRLPLTSKANSCTGLNEKGGEVPKIERGRKIGIACLAAGRRDAAVNVVMLVDPDQGKNSIGYQAFLVTEQTIENGMVHVRIPDMPDLANHTVDVKVFVTDEAGTSSCDAGRIKIL
jgi:hypothetical protein